MVNSIIEHIAELNSMTKKRLEKFKEVVRELEKREFPEFTGDSIYASPSDERYFYFAPSWHVMMGLLSQDFIHGAQDHKKRILSVGAGPAYLERFLTIVMGVRREQITLADKYDVMPEDYERFIFDMYGKWPDFGKRFDYVLFPESVLLNTTFGSVPEIQKGLYHIIESSLATLNPVGQIRIDAHNQIEDRVAPVKQRLGLHHPDARLIYTRSLIVVERGYKK